MEHPESFQSLSGADRMRNEYIRRLTRESIFIGSLRYKAGHTTGWRMTFWVKNFNLSRDEIKEHISTYLQSEFSAFDIEYFKDREGNTYCTFSVPRR